jgi:hypothetical protein
MRPASVFPSGGLNTSTVRNDEAAGSLAGKPEDTDGPNLPDPYAGEPRWAAWKVTLFVLLFCGAFWAGIAWLVMRLFG